MQLFLTVGIVALLFNGILLLSIPTETRGQAFTDLYDNYEQFVPVEEHNDQWIVEGAGGAVLGLYGSNDTFCYSGASSCRHEVNAKVEMDVNAEGNNGTIVVSWTAAAFDLTGFNSSRTPWSAGERLNLSGDFQLVYNVFYASEFSRFAEGGIADNLFLFGANETDSSFAHELPRMKGFLATWGPVTLLHKPLGTSDWIDLFEGVNDPERPDISPVSGSVIISNQVYDGEFKIYKSVVNGSECNSSALFEGWAEKNDALLGRGCVDSDSGNPVELHASLKASGLGFDSNGIYGAVPAWFHVHFPAGTITDKSPPPPEPPGPGFWTPLTIGIGIGIGSLVVLIALVLGAVTLVRRRRRAKQQARGGNDDADDYEGHDESDVEVKTLDHSSLDNASGVNSATALTAPEAVAVEVDVEADVEKDGGHGAEGEASEPGVPEQVPEEQVPEKEGEEAQGDAVDDQEVSPEPESTLENQTEPEPEPEVEPEAEKEGKRDPETSTSHDQPIE